MKDDDIQVVYGFYKPAAPNANAAHAFDDEQLEWQHATPTPEIEAFAERMKQAVRTYYRSHDSCKIKRLEIITRHDAYQHKLMAIDPDGEELTVNWENFTRFKLDERCVQAGLSHENGHTTVAPEFDRLWDDVQEGASLISQLVTIYTDRRMEKSERQSRWEDAKIRLPYFSPYELAQELTRVETAWLNEQELPRNVRILFDRRLSELESTCLGFENILRCIDERYPYEGWQDALKAEVDCAEFPRKQYVADALKLVRDDRGLQEFIRGMSGFISKHIDYVEEMHCDTCCCLEGYAAELKQVSDIVAANRLPELPSHSETPLALALEKIPLRHEHPSPKFRSEFSAMFLPKEAGRGF